MTTVPRERVATVLVITADHNIEVLLGELIAFAGHRPMYDVTMGAAGDSIRRVRPDVVMLDTALLHGVVDACLGAIDEVGAAAILVSSTASTDELATQALALRRLHFPLPAGPKPLARVLERAIERARDKAVTIPYAAHGDVAASVQPAVRAALTRLASGERTGDTAGGLSALRAAVTDYAHQLRAAATPLDDALSIVRHEVRNCAQAMGADSSVLPILRQTEHWASEAYRTR